MNNPNVFKLTKYKATDPEFKKILKSVDERTLRQAREVLFKYPNLNKTALNRILTELKRRNKRFYKNINKENEMNKNFYIGNLTRDPELNETSNGIKFCSFTIAVNRSYSGADGERKTDFIPCVAWRGLAENVAKHVKKGNRVAISGELHTNTYDDAQGNKRSAFEVVVADVEFLSPRASAEGDKINEDLKPQPLDDDSDIPF